MIDTNITLDLFVFNDEAALPLRTQLESGQLTWLATPAMRTELARVLAYPQIAPRLLFYKLTKENVLAQFDLHTTTVDTPPKAPVTCADPDDQIFIDLAVAHQAILLSKDKAVLTMKKRLAALHVKAGRTLQEVTA
ncbi:MAG: putative toxin-antitoxin system toxin component, PIN family [Bdellovibrionales bacterium]|nr:putative toxin-antitoxin system toxin component, PIN family [Ramlibacter sp.]